MAREEFNISGITIDELIKIPYFSKLKTPNRFIPSFMFYDNEEWHSWFFIRGELKPFKAFPAEGNYFAKRPENETDIFNECINFLGQRGNILSTQRAFTGLTDDILNLAASLEKIDFIFNQRESINHGIDRIVITELEYIFLVCRSIFDLLQEVISNIWKNVRLKNGKKPRQLKDSFSKTALFDGKTHLKGDYSERFHFPPELDDFYFQNQDFFKDLRSFRDHIAHGGGSFKIVFLTERGFAVQKDQKPFSSYNIWSEEHMLPNNLCSLKPAISYTVLKTLEACNSFASVISRIVEFPEPLTEDFYIFTKCIFGHQINALKRNIDNCLWYDE